MVSTSPLVKTYTLEEFWELPEPLDHSKLELIAGVLYMTPPPGYLHNNSVSRLNRLLVDYQTKMGDQGRVYVPRAGIVKGPNSWLEPDLFYIAATTNALYDRNTKADTYAALGVKELWLVDEASGIIELRTLEGDQYGASVVFERDDYLKSVVLPGFEVKVSSVFDD